MEEPNQAWFFDITYVWTASGWLYLATVMDLYSWCIVGWSMDISMTRKLVMDGLSMAFWRRKPSKGCIHHSDRGSRYCSDDFQQLLKQYGMVCSMSRKGNSCRAHSYLDYLSPSEYERVQQTLPKAA
ncbi:MAG: DDE-type integrase/transposase/recombinase [Mariprofundaceae bacterium]|nr:DDE-type integrase/transposase/recombinase [Mariprofundaceae bacterium]